jgi:hypothetical protein|tara:strand:+ start:4088 stop:4363 length:276 start_codon:yes stop_codon:yes gene_type:complete
MTDTPGYAKTIHKEKESLTLDQLQKLVGGYIELVNLPNTKEQMIINEEGKLIGLPVNETATKIFHENYPHLQDRDVICGDAIILSGKARMK